MNPKEVRVEKQKFMFAIGRTSIVKLFGLRGTRRYCSGTGDFLQARFLVSPHVAPIRDRKRRQHRDWLPSQLDSIFCKNDRGCSRGILLRNRTRK